MESNAAEKFFIQNYYEEKKTMVQTMQEFSDQQNAYLIEALDYALQTIILQSESKSIGDLDERISHFERILKEHGK